MDSQPDIARIARLLADPGRALILRALIDGTMRPAGELAYSANISAQAASGHLAKLVRGGLLSSEAQGRHRYFRISNPEVAHALESLGSLSVALRPRDPRPPAVPRTTPILFLHSRTCYDHLAGEAAVEICERMLKARWIAAEGRDFKLTHSGEKKLTKLGIDPAELRRAPRTLARSCVDLTQRRPHVGGALGAALLETYFSRGWILRVRGSRAVSITPKGRAAFENLFT